MMKSTLTLVLCALALVFMTTPARAQDNCEITSTCPPKTPRRTPPPPPPPPPDPCNASWQRADRSGTIANYETFLRSCPRHSRAPAARKRVAVLRCDAQYATALRAGTESAMQGFVNACGDHPKADDARIRMATLRCDEQWQTASLGRTLDGFESFTRSCATHARFADARGFITAIRANPLDIKGLPASTIPIPREGLSAENRTMASKCDGGDAFMCGKVGYAFDTGQGAPKTPRWAKGLYVRACAAGNTISCANLGILLYTDTGEGRDRSRAAILAQQSCDLGGKTGCTLLGFIHEKGEVFPFDARKAIAFYEQACDQGKTGGHDVGCLYAARWYEGGYAPIAKDPAKALQLVNAGLKLNPNNADLTALANKLRTSSR